jgi:hypothetical protein
MPGELSGKAAIVGIDATDFSKNSGRSELRLAAAAVLDALDDARLTPADVNGMVTFTMDSSTEVDHRAGHRYRGAEVLLEDSSRRWRGMRHDSAGGGRGGDDRRGLCCGIPCVQRTFGNAVRASADAVGGERRFDWVDNSFSYPHGLSTSAAQLAMIAKRYMDLSGATSKDFGAGFGRRPQARGEESERRTSTRSRSPLRITRIRGGSPNRCGRWTPARRPTVPSQLSSRRRSGPRISSWVCRRWVWLVDSLWLQSGLKPTGCPSTPTVAS